MSFSVKDVSLGNEDFLHECNLNLGKYFTSENIFSSFTIEWVFVFFNSIFKFDSNENRSQHLVPVWECC